jgi:uncharacterized protein YeaO (DUF488 family)
MESNCILLNYSDVGKTIWGSRLRLTIRTKSIFQPIEREDGYRVLITRFYPRGVQRTHFDDWVTSLSPQKELLFQYKQGIIDWNRFTHSFIAQLKDDVESLDAIHALHDWGLRHNITLLCYERTGVPCHRHLVRDIIENPALLGMRLESENADHHEGIAMQCHVTDEKAPVIARVG